MHSIKDIHFNHDSAFLVLTSLDHTPTFYNVWYGQDAFQFADRYLSVRRIKQAFDIDEDEFSVALELPDGWYPTYSIKRRNT